MREAILSKYVASNFDQGSILDQLLNVAKDVTKVGPKLECADKRFNP